MRKLAVFNQVSVDGTFSMFDGIKQRLSLALKGTRSFDNGNVVLWYERTA